MRFSMKWAFKIMRLVVISNLWQNLLQLSGVNIIIEEHEVVMIYEYGDRTHYYTNNHDTIKRQIEEEEAKLYRYKRFRL